MLLSLWLLFFLGGTDLLNRGIRLNSAPANDMHEMQHPILFQFLGLRLLPSYEPSRLSEERLEGTKGLHSSYVLLEHQTTVTSRDYKKTFLSKKKPLWTEKDIF